MEVATDVSIESPSTDCSTVSNVDDPSFNVCFADADNPISTVPEFLAQMQAERIAHRLLVGIEVAVLAPLEKDGAISLNPEDQATPQLVLKQPSRDSECSVFDQECKQAPSGPNALQVQASTVPPVTEDFIPDMPIWHAAEVQNPGTPNLGLAPSEGHQFPLDEPPELA